MLFRSNSATGYRDGVEVHDDIGKVEALEGVGDAVPVTRGAVLASIQVVVGNKVWERIRLDEEHKSRVGVGLQDLDDG